MKTIAVLWITALFLAVGDTLAAADTVEEDNQELRVLAGESETISIDDAGEVHLSFSEERSTVTQGDAIEVVLENNTDAPLSMGRQYYIDYYEDDDNWVDLELPQHFTDDIVVIEPGDVHVFNVILLPEVEDLLVDIPPFEAGLYRFRTEFSIGDESEVDGHEIAGEFEIGEDEQELRVVTGEPETVSIEDAGEVHLSFSDSEATLTSGDAIEVVLENNTDAPLSMGRQYHIDYNEDDDTWREIELPLGFNADIVVVEPGDSYLFNMILVPETEDEVIDAPTFETGQYRFRTEFSIGEETEIDGHEISIEFHIGEDAQELRIVTGEPQSVSIDNAGEVHLSFSDSEVTLTPGDAIEIVLENDTDALLSMGRQYHIDYNEDGDTWRELELLLAFTLDIVVVEPGESHVFNMMLVPEDVNEVSDSPEFESGQYRFRKDFSIGHESAIDDHEISVQFEIAEE